ncbi:MAG: hypothetical protein LBK99_18050 [Opitutaceae bacterium]|nr:hypothetical protein [Opitutaceae bacterium]
MDKSRSIRQRPSAPVAALAETTGVALAAAGDAARPTVTFSPGAARPHTGVLTERCNTMCPENTGGSVTAARNTLGNVTPPPTAMVMASAPPRVRTMARASRVVIIVVILFAIIIPWYAAAICSRRHP